MYDIFTFSILLFPQPSMEIGERRSAVPARFRQTDRARFPVGLLANAPFSSRCWMHEWQTCSLLQSSRRRSPAKDGILHPLPKPG